MSIFFEPLSPFELLVECPNPSKLIVKVELLGEACCHFFEDVDARHFLFGTECLSVLCLRPFVCSLDVGIPGVFLESSLVPEGVHKSVQHRIVDFFLFNHLYQVFHFLLGSST